VEAYRVLRCRASNNALKNGSQMTVRFVRFEVFTAVAMKNGVFWDVTPVALVRNDVSE
jgi:hypothetical protein